jgi:lipopolysaccharide transport system ATP-binding protein
MSNIAIQCYGISKRYCIGERQSYKALRDVLTDAFKSPFRRLRRARGGSEDRENGKPTIWALRDVSFEIKHGEVVGIIGRNGSGKSTLLKVLSQVTEPTCGYAEINGRVGSLLEVGSGFHPELTGRENIFLNGAILGMRKMEIKRRLDEIVAFAEVERFVDTAVKHYSSGMYLRLAFAVAAHLEPEILLVDEVLAVGDAAFQRKCLGKMNDVARKGRTIVFVSHNMVALRSLCDRVVWLEGGVVVQDGPGATVISQYLRRSLSARLGAFWPDNETAPGNQEVRLLSAQIVPESDESTIFVETPLSISVTYRVLQAGILLNTSLAVYNSEDICVFNTISPPTDRPAGLVREVCLVPGKLLNDGTYRVRVMIVKDTGVLLIDHLDAVTFQITESARPFNWYGKWVGVVRPELAWASEALPETSRDARCESSLGGAYV